MVVVSSVISPCFGGTLSDQLRPFPSGYFLRTPIDSLMLFLSIPLYLGSHARAEQGDSVPLEEKID